MVYGYKVWFNAVKGEHKFWENKLYKVDEVRMEKSELCKWHHIFYHCVRLNMYRVFNLKVDCFLIWVIYLLRFTTCYITHLTCIYSKCWKLYPFISMHLLTRFTMILATFFSVVSFTSSMAWVIFIFNCFRSRWLVR